jgi:hypothetical protein
MLMREILREDSPATQPLTLDQIKRMSFEEFVSSGRFDRYAEEMDEINELMLKPDDFDFSNEDYGLPAPHWMGGKSLSPEEQEAWDNSDHARRLLTDHIRQQFNKAQQRLSRDLSYGARTGYYSVERYLQVPNTQRWLAKLTKNGGGPLGIYWTYDSRGWKKAAGDHGGWEPQAVWAKGKGPTVVIEAEAPASSVDWEATLVAHMNWYSGYLEHELTLRAGAPVAVQALVNRYGRTLPGSETQHLATLRFTA